MLWVLNINQRLDTLKLTYPHNLDLNNTKPLISLRLHIYVLYMLPEEYKVAFNIPAFNIKELKKKTHL